jgi:hypothetical protein
MKKLRYLCVASLFATASCAVQKSENPLAPTVAGPIAGVQISAPKPLEPGVGAQIPGDKQPLTLLVENALSTGQRPLNYLFEVATDTGFNNRVFAQDSVPPGDGGRTALRLPDVLPMGRAYYWRAKAQDGANEGPYSSPVTFNVFTPVAFDKPTLISPINNEKVTTPRPTFRFANAPHVGSPISTGYVMEIATGDSFANKIAVWQLNEGENDNFPSGADLPGGTQLFWHARAIAPPVLGPWSDTQVFRTPTPVVVAPPSPTPGPSGGSCSSKSSQLAVVECRRAQYGHMSPDQLNQFLRAVSRDLNAGNFPSGPYGIYPKTSGNNCGGFSCDIICTQAGDAYDTLLDSEGAQIPIWGYKGPGLVGCQIQR